MKKQVGLKLEVGLIERVDSCAALLGQSRTAFIEEALVQAVWGSPGTDGSPGPVVSRTRQNLDRPARVVGSRGAASSSVAKRGVAPRWRGGVEGSV